MKRIIAAVLLCITAMTGCGMIEEPDDAAADHAVSARNVSQKAEAEEDYSMERLYAGNKTGTADRKIIDVENILQNPELPTGCECVSLTILLNYYGYDVDKLTIAREYQPKMEFTYCDGELYGADFRTTFAGDPESESSYGCYAPCIVETANNYFAANGQAASAVDVTGKDFDSMLSEYIDNDAPALIWVTNKELHEPEYTTVWTVPNGEQVQWLAYEHCVVLTGYDRDNGRIYVSDPLIGNTSYSYTKIKQRYEDMGQQAVVIENK